MNSITKKCSKCKTEKDIDSFGNDKKRKDGKNLWCRECFHKYYESNASKILRRIKEYMSTRKEEKRRYDKARRENDDGKLKEQKRLFFQENKDRLQKINKEYAKNHPEQMRVYKKKWKSQNKEKVLADTRNRRARIRWNGGILTEKDWKEVLDMYGEKCLKCGSPDNIEVDHVIPVSCGGVNDKTNVQPLCRSCNAKKGARTIDYR